MPIALRQEQQHRTRDGAVFIMQFLKARSFTCLKVAFASLMHKRSVENSMNSFASIPTANWPVIHSFEVKF